MCHMQQSVDERKPETIQTRGSLEEVSPVLQNKDRDFFECKAKCLKGIQFGAQGSRGQQLLAAIEASYVVAYKVTKQQKCHTIAETLIMPCAKAMVAKLCGEDQAKKLSVVPLSNNTIRRRVDDMAEDILVQVIEKVKSSLVKFCLQFDESTDIASCAVLLGYIR